jgi:Pyruvate/2-oxoglutarate dehydrogenase complex, dihydrolipoamide acyltransferase (E2) component, and related enzymes
MLKWYSPESGVICWHKYSGDMVSQKEPILTMFSRQGEKVFQSPYDGILLLKNPIHAPHQYQELAKFLVP